MMITNRFGISGESMRRIDIDDFATEQHRESERWKGRFFHGSLFGGRYICIDKLLLQLLQPFLMDCIDRRTANIVDHVLNVFQRDFTMRYRGLVFYEKVYPEGKPIVFKKIEKLGHRFQCVHVGPSSRYFEIHLDVEAQYA